MSQKLYPSQEVVLVLLEQLEKLKSAYPNYSLRRFSKKIGVPSPILSEVLNGKRKITRQLGAQLLVPLAMDSDLKSRLIASLPTQRDRKKKSIATALPNKSVKKLSEFEFQVIADWWYFAVLALLDAAVPITKPEELIHYFSISKRQANLAIEKLLQLGLIRKINTIYKSTGIKLKTTQDIPSVYVRTNHAQGLELAKESLYSVPVELRDLSSVTLALDPAILPELKSEFKKFRARISDLMEKSQGQEIYRFQMQLFPLSKLEKKL